MLKCLTFLCEDPPQPQERVKPLAPSGFACTRWLRFCSAKNPACGELVGSGCSLLTLSGVTLPVPFRTDLAANNLTFGLFGI